MPCLRAQAGKQTHFFRVTSNALATGLTRPYNNNDNVSTEAADRLEEEPVQTNTDGMVNIQMENIGANEKPAKKGLYDQMADHYVNTRWSTEWV